MEKYLLFIDIDGTLVKPLTNTVDEEIINEFKRLKKDCHKIIISTGRALNSSYKVEGVDNADYVATMLGGVIVIGKTKEIIHKSNTINSNCIKSFVEDVEKHGLKWLYKDCFTEKSYINDEELITDYNIKLITKSDFEKDLSNNSVFQLIVLGNLPDEIMKKHSIFDYFKMPGNYYDVIAKGSSKGDIVKYFKEKYPNYATVAIGDSNNDVGMFKAADISISMANAEEDIKQLTTYVTKSVMDNGVIYAIKEILKI